MKRGCCVVVMILFVQISNAQTWDEWFKQKKTQIKYLVQQIAALKVYTDYLEKGYEIAREGLSTINDIKNGDFDLHKGHFDSLKIVNPSVKESFYVADAMIIATKIDDAAKSGLKNVERSKSFTSDEVEYLQWAYENINEQSAADIDELTLLVTNGELQMTDDERLKRVETIYASLQDKYSFVKSFSKQAQILSIQRTKQQSETGMVKEFYGIK